MRVQMYFHDCRVLTAGSCASLEDPVLVSTVSNNVYSTLSDQAGNVAHAMFCMSVCCCMSTRCLILMMSAYVCC